MLHPHQKGLNNIQLIDTRRSNRRISFSCNYGIFNRRLPVPSCLSHSCTNHLFNDSYEKRHEEMMESAAEQSLVQ